MTVTRLSPSCPPFPISRFLYSAFCFLLSAFCFLLPASIHGLNRPPRLTSGLNKLVLINNILTIFLRSVAFPSSTHRPAKQPSNPASVFCAVDHVSSTSARQVCEDYLFSACRYLLIDAIANIY
ncbi:hypothetical protein [Raoultella terrigena]|uniref:hypothetical protein n=1 Tax=Raoultella terrigena TaxID=577 RepID=UPI00384F5703